MKKNPDLFFSYKKMNFIPLNLNIYLSNREIIISTCVAWNQQFSWYLYNFLQYILHFQFNLTGHGYLTNIDNTLAEVRSVVRVLNGFTVDSVYQILLLYPPVPSLSCRNSLLGFSHCSYICLVLPRYMLKLEKLHVYLEHFSIGYIRVDTSFSKKRFISYALYLVS